MGKGKLGLRGRLFQDLIGEGFDPNQLLIMAIDSAKYQPKAAVFNYFGEMVHGSFFFHSRPLWRRRIMPDSGKSFTEY